MMKGQLEVVVFGIAAIVAALCVLVYYALPYLLMIAVASIVMFRLFGGHVARNGKWYPRKESPRQYRLRHRRM